MRRFFLRATLTTACAFSAIARGDAVWISSGAANALELPNVKVTGIREGKVLFQAANGNLSSREIHQIARLRIDDEPQLNGAEEALAAQQWEQATEGFRKALSTTAKEWLRPWIAQRMVLAAQQARRFDAAAAGYVTLVLTDPGRAADFRPALPDGRSQYVAAALNDVTRALGTPNLAAAQRQALMSFQIDLQRARGDQQAAAQTLEQMLQSGVAAADDPAATAQLARLKLQQAAMQLDKSDFNGAAGIIRSNAGVFVEPREQAQALYYLAEAQAGAAQQSNDRAAWQDAALAYLRVVAHFKESPGAPFVALSLVKTGQIQERLNNPAAAGALYEQVVAQYPQDPAAATARALAERLKGNSP